MENKPIDKIRKVFTQTKQWMLRIVQYIKNYRLIFGLYLDKWNDWKIKTFRYVKYNYRLTFWVCLNKWRIFLSFLSQYFDLIRRVSFILVSIIVGYLVYNFGNFAFTKDILSNYLIASGAMTGGIIAIVFTISIFLLQNASDLYSSQYFEVYIHDWKEKFVYYVVVLITILLLGGGLYIGNISDIDDITSTYIIFISLFAIGAVFALVDWQYKTVLQKINPLNAIAFLEKEGTLFLKRIEYDAEKIAEIFRAKDENLSKELALATAYNQLLQPFISNLDRQLENLVEITMKLGDRQEIGTTKRGFTAIYSIITKFFEARKTSSLIIPSGTVFLATEVDSQKFLLHNFERLNKSGQKFIKEDKDELATYIIDVYRGLANNAQNIAFISRTNENPIFDLIIGYLNYFIEMGERAKNIEVVYQGVQVLEYTSIIASKKGFSLTLHGLLEKIMSVASYGLSQKQIIVTDYCSTSLLNIISAVFLSLRIDKRIHINDALKNIATIANQINTFTKMGLFPLANFSVSKGYDEFYSVLVTIINHYDNLPNKEKSSYRVDLIEFFREINMSLRSLSENIKSCDTILTDSISRLLFNINDIIIDLIQNSEFEEEVDELKKRLGWNIHLPSFFVTNSDSFDGGSNFFNTLTDCVAKTGILIGAKLEDKELLQDCINCLYTITNYALEKTTSKYGFDEPRILEKACYLGIIASKKNWMDVVADIKIKIQEFEKKYYEKYLTNLPSNLFEGFDPRNHNIGGLPHHDQLFRELLGWRGSYEREAGSRMSGLRDDAETIIWDVIKPIDVNKFILEIWGISIE